MKDLMQWRAEEGRSAKELEQAQKKETRRVELSQAKDFAEFKRTRKQMAKDAEQKRIKYDYETGKAHVEWQRKQKLLELEKQKTIALQKEEKAKEEREKKNIQVYLLISFFGFHILLYSHLVFRMSRFSTVQLDY